MRGAGGWSSQKGYYTFLAVFIIVMLSGLGLYMAKMAAANNFSMALAVQREQTYFAARAGLEWAINSAQQPGNHDTVCSTGPATTSSFSLTGGLLSRYNVTVYCDDQRNGGYNEVGTIYEVDRMTATATGGRLTLSGFMTRGVRSTVAQP